DARPGDTNGDGSAGFGAQWYVVVVGTFAAPSPPAAPPGISVQPMPPAPVVQQPPAPVVQQPPAPAPVIAQPPSGTAPSYGAFPPGTPPGSIYGPGAQQPFPLPYQGPGQGYPYPGPSPQSLMATAVASPAGTVSLSWQGLPIAASYRIYRA